MWKVKVRRPESLSEWRLSLSEVQCQGQLEVLNASGNRVSATLVKADTTLTWSGLTMPPVGPVIEALDLVKNRLKALASGSMPESRICSRKLAPWQSTLADSVIGDRRATSSSLQKCWAWASTPRWRVRSVWRIP